MLNRNIHTFLGCDAQYDEAGIVLAGAPFDSTASYRPGARDGSRAVRNESFGLESFSPYQEKDLFDVPIFDAGDLELPMGDSVRMLEMVWEHTVGVLEDGKIPVLVGGEHLVTLGSAQAVFEKFPELRIVHFDAHADLRDDYLGVQYSHACVMRRCWDALGDGKIFQFGIRSGDRTEFEWAKDHVFTQRFGFDNLKGTTKLLQGMPVYLTVDLDVMDPAAFPGTGTPEAGGVSFHQLLDAVLTVCRECQVVGADIVELSPGLDPSGVSTATAGKLLRELLLAL